MFASDTIAAISTPMGIGGIGVIRISGEQCFEIAARVFHGRKPFGEIKSHTVSHGRIVEPSTGETLDEVLLIKMARPHTFTREDVVELNCHGGTVVLLRVLKLLVKEGARPAEPGEFTKRAFLNGRMDLSQAEAVIDLIHSKTAEGSRAAVIQLEGRLSEKIRDARKKLIEMIAHLEVTVDYPEHDIEELTGKQVYEEVGKVSERLKAITEGFERGRILREGISAAIVGKPNVGKSSLLNELAGKNRAIVTDIPGTTRDVIEEYINIRGIPVRLMDTAGIRETEDPVERIGVEKAQSVLDSADVVIMVLDAVSGIEPEDRFILDKVQGKKTIYIINKTDAAGPEAVRGVEREIRDKLVMDQESIRTEFTQPGVEAVIKAAIKHGTGVDKLEDRIEELFARGGIRMNNEILLTNVRHKNLVDKALESLQDAASAYENAMPLDFITIDIKNAADFLGQITGESVSEDVVQEIFSRFCVGK